MWSEVQDLSSHTLDHRFKSCLVHGCSSLVILCCVVLCMYRPCDKLITCPSSPTVCHTLIKIPLGWPYAPEGVTGNIHTYIHTNHSCYWHLAQLNYFLKERQIYCVCVSVCARARARMHTEVHMCMCDMPLHVCVPTHMICLQPLQMNYLHTTDELFLHCV
jgi:hypothetical protein